MDNTTFKPYTYDATAFVDPELATTNAITSVAGSGAQVTSLELSSFSNYTASEQNLNMLAQRVGVNKYIGNSLMYISAGDTQSEYTTGVLTTPSDPQQNLLNRYDPTVNFHPSIQRLTREQIGGHFLPDRLAVLNYVSVKPRFRVLQERLTPGQLYVIADPTIYGSGYGNNSCVERDLPVDHDEDVTWLKSPPVYIGQSGRIVNSNKLPNFFNYTSTEQTLGAPKFGVSKFTDNFDFFAGSEYGDIWANQDIYKLKEANKYDIAGRQLDLLTDVCDSPYRWRTDIYGNEYMLYKMSTQRPKRTAGGSDTDGDGKDDEMLPYAGDPDYYAADFDAEGELVLDPTGQGVNYNGGGSLFGADPTDGGGYDPGVPGSNDRVIEDINVEYADSTRSQLPLAECDHFLYGGESLSPYNSSTNLNDIYTFQTQNTTATSSYTVAGGVSAIIDGGWRSLSTQPANGGDENQYEQTVSTAIADVVNGFFDQSAYQTLSAAFNKDSDKIKWLPDWTRQKSDTSDDRRFPALSGENSSAHAGLTFTFGSDTFTTSQHDRAYVFTPPVSQRRQESDKNFPYVLADGGWYVYNTTETFFRTQCDRASYILARYGVEGAPDFGNHIFACKIFEITDDPITYLNNPDILKQVYNNDEKERNKDLQYAAARGPLNALHFRNPIEWSYGGEDNNTFARKIQFFGTENILNDWKKQISKSNKPSARLARLPNIAFDYLTRGEYYYMRVSDIEGSGNQIDGSACFFDNDLSKHGSAEARQRYLGTPDIFYYVSGGELDQSIVDQWSSSPEEITYEQLSSSMSYINPGSVEMVLHDFTDTATQFPQVPYHQADKRLYNMWSGSVSGTVETYNQMSCHNVSEYRVFSGDVVVDDSTYFSDGDVEIDRDVKDTHPVSRFHDLTFKSKRGYFPPPVGHLRRPAEYPTGASPVTSSTAPINHNLLPEDGYYVHDVWDGSGFIFQAGADNTSVEEEIDDGTKKEPGVDIGDTVEFVPEGNTTVTLTGDVVVDLGCGDYTGYFNTSAVSASPCFSELEAPLGSVAQMVKRSSDSLADICRVAGDTPTLWEQKHQITQIAPVSSTNVVVRNLYSDDILILSDILPNLTNQFTQVNKEPPLINDRAYIDMDVINDTLVLRQSNLAGNVESYVFDQIKFDYSTGDVTLGQRATNTISTSPVDNSQVICHYYNEDDNCVIVGTTREKSSTHVYPELYKLDLSTQVFKQIFPLQHSVEEFKMTPENLGNVACDIISVDPGEISYNVATNNYSITYFANVKPTNPTNDPGESLVIFNHIFEGLDDGVSLVSANMYRSQNINSTQTGSVTSSGVARLSATDTQPINLTTNSHVYELMLNMDEVIIIETNKSVNVMQMHIDWGDGHNDVIYSDLDSNLNRYGEDDVKISPSTTLLTNKGENTVASLIKHRVKHTYDISSSETLSATVSFVMNDSSTYSNQIIITPVPPEIENALGGVKLLNTRLYSTPGNTQKQHLLLTIETQGATHTGDLGDTNRVVKRTVSNNIIDINT